MQSNSRLATPEISVDELDVLMHAGSVRLLDVRETWEFRRGRVPGAVSLPLGQLPQGILDLRRDRPYAVICEHGNRSLAAADFMLRNGFAGAVSVAGGTAAWARAQRALERD